jgi:hypothetical protein
MIDCLCTWSRRTKGICKAGIHDGTIHILMAGATFQHMKRNSHHRPMAHGGRVILGSGGGHRTSKPSATRLPGLGPAKMKKNGVTHKSSVRGFRDELASCNAWVPGRRRSVAHDPRTLGDNFAFARMRWGPLLSTLCS